jgi:hypothetical protein
MPQFKYLIRFHSNGNLPNKQGWLKVESAKMGVRDLVYSIFDDHDLVRMLMQQWLASMGASMDTLADIYVAMYRVIFETPLCFSITRDAILTHKLNGFEVKISHLNQKQNQLLDDFYKNGKYTKAFNKFVQNQSYTNVEDLDTDAPWCNPTELFSLFIDEELHRAKDAVEFVVRADCMSIVLQDMLHSVTSLDYRQHEYMQRALEALHTRMTALGNARFPMEEGAFYAQLCG